MCVSAMAVSGCEALSEQLLRAAENGDANETKVLQ